MLSGAQGGCAGAGRHAARCLEAVGWTGHLPALSRCPGSSSGRQRSILLERDSCSFLVCVVAWAASNAEPQDRLLDDRFRRGQNSIVTKCLSQVPEHVAVGVCAVQFAGAKHQ